MEEVSTEGRPDDGAVDDDIPASHKAVAELAGVGSVSSAFKAGDLTGMHKLFGDVGKLGGASSAARAAGLSQFNNAATAGLLADVAKASRMFPEGRTFASSGVQQAVADLVGHGGLSPGLKNLGASASHKAVAELAGVGSVSSAFKAGDLTGMHKLFGDVGKLGGASSAARAAGLSQFNNAATAGLLADVAKASRMFPEGRTFASSGVQQAVADLVGHGSKIADKSTWTTELTVDALLNRRCGLVIVGVNLILFGSFLATSDNRELRVFGMILISLGGALFGAAV